MPAPESNRKRSRRKGSAAPCRRPANGCRTGRADCRSRSGAAAGAPSAGHPAGGSQCGAVSPIAARRSQTGRHQVCRHQACRNQARRKQSCGAQSGADFESGRTQGVSRVIPGANGAVAGAVRGAGARRKRSRNGRTAGRGARGRARTNTCCSTVYHSAFWCTGTMRFCLPTVISSNGAATQDLAAIEAAGGLDMLPCARRRRARRNRRRAVALDLAHEMAPRLRSRAACSPRPGMDRRRWP